MKLVSWTSTALIIRLRSSKYDRKENPGALVEKQSDPYRSHSFYVIRVFLKTAVEPREGVNMYKSIMLYNREHTKEVIRNSMIKHSLEGSPDDFTLSQLLPDKELEVPLYVNVYYAIEWYKSMKIFHL